ncbi:MAG: YccF domain-containing protein, partial [Candidatus Wallbacteria bacterium]|nr:YccF domain-containing protein [Candidatus Wallbacteria bacterium]
VTRYERIATEQSGLLLRLLWFVLVGWWASLAWMIASYLLMLTIIGIPLGLMMVNRLPFVFSLHRGYA